jgi:hypothetical protein
MLADPEKLRAVKPDVVFWWIGRRDVDTTFLRRTHEVFGPGSGLDPPPRVIIAFDSNQDWEVASMRFFISDDG